MGENPDKILTHAPKVSVLICSHKKTFLLEAVTSAINQTIPRGYFEIVVILDYSDENVEKWLNEKAVKYFILPSSKWGEAMAYGIERLHGDIICFLDDDDLFYPNKLNRIIELFEENSNLIYIHNSAQFISYNDTLLKNPIKTFDRTFCFKNDPQSLKQIRKILMASTKNHIDFNVSSITVRRESIIPYANIIRKLPTMIDTILFYLSLNNEGYIMNTTDCLTKYRFHDSVSNSIIINSDSLSKYRRWTGEIEKSLHILMMSTQIHNIRDFVFAKKVSVSLITNILTGDLNEDSPLLITFLRTNLKFRPLYSLFLLFLAGIKFLLPKKLYYPFSLFLFRIFFILPR